MQRTKRASYGANVVGEELDSELRNATQGQSTDPTATVTASATFRQAVLDLFSTTNSILLGRSVKCSVTPQSPVACTDGESVFFNASVIDAVRVRRSEAHKVSELAHLIGVNYHEVAHILYSPRTTSKLYRELKNNTHQAARSRDLFRILNLLEDQRIETLFSGKFINSVPYFRQAITRLILDDTSHSHKFHLWLHGRKYIPSDVREQARELFHQHYKVEDSDLAEWDALVDEFRKLVFPRQINRAVEIVLRYKQLCEKYSISDFSTANGDDHRHNDGSASSVGEQDEARESSDELEELFEQQDDDSDASDSTATSESDEDSEDDDADDADGDAEDEDADTDGSSSGDGNGASSDASGDGNEITNSQSNADSQEPSSSTSNSSSRGTGASAGDGGSEESTKEQRLIERLEDTLAQSNETVFQESSKILSQIRHKVDSLALDSVFGNIEAPRAVVPAPSHYSAVYNSINKALQQLRADADSSWERGTHNGRLNIDLLLQSDIRDRDLPVFDTWQDDTDDAPSVEVVILLDQSSSMNGHTPTPNGAVQTLMDEASASVWAIKKACQTNGLPCTVVGYSDANQTSVLLRADDKVHPHQVGLYNYKRSTEARVALSVAKTIFQRSDARHKILFSISDGAWCGEYEEIVAVNAINALGVETVFVALPCQYEYDYTQSPPVSKPIHFFNGWARSGREAVDPKAVKQASRTIYGPSGTYNGSTTVTVEYRPYGYNHKTTLLIGNSNDLAKQLGKVIVSATAGVR